MISHKLKLRIKLHLNRVKLEPNMMRISNVKIMKDLTMSKRTATHAATLLKKIEIMTAVKEDVIHLMIEKEEAVMANNNRITSYLSLIAHRLNLNLNLNYTYSSRSKSHSLNNHNLSNHNKDLKSLKTC
jgi:hypothetical protein